MNLPFLSMNFLKVQKFGDLTHENVYKILQIRAEVFVVEQHCNFLDADGDKDYKAHHLWYENTNGQILAYTRLLPAGVAYAEASIGRVLVHSTQRNTGLGIVLMNQSIESLYQLYGVQPIRIGAQLYLQKFYEKFGFVKTSDIYHEDEIPHIKMLKI
jgi:ElaA protein